MSGKHRICIDIPSKQWELYKARAECLGMTPVQFLELHVEDEARHEANHLECERRGISIQQFARKWRRS